MSKRTIAGVAALAFAGFLLVTAPSDVPPTDPTMAKLAASAEPQKTALVSQQTASTTTRQATVNTATSPPEKAQMAAAQPRRTPETLPPAPTRDVQPPPVTPPSRTSPTVISPLVAPAKQAAPAPQPKLKIGPVEAGSESTGQSMRPVMRPPSKAKLRLALYAAPSPRMQPPPRMQW